MCWVCFTIYAVDAGKVLHRVAKAKVMLERIE